MRKHLMLALALMLGLSSAEFALADDTSGSAPAAGSSNSGSTEAKPKKERRLGKRLGKLRDRLHRKKSTDGAAKSGTGAAPQQ